MHVPYANSGVIAPVRGIGPSLLSGTKSAVPRRRWRSYKTSYCTDRSANGSTNRCSVPTSCRGPDCSSASCADKAATDRPLDGIVGISASR